MISICLSLELIILFSIYLGNYIVSKYGLTSEINKYKNIENLEVHEEAGSYSTTIVLNKDKFKDIQKENIDLPEGYYIRGSTKKEKLKSAINIFNKRENILYFVKSAVETTINIEDMVENTNLRLITTRDINNVMRTIKNKEHRKKIGYVHIGAVQILLKATHADGTNSPIKIILMDDRITDKYDSILGIMDANLAYTKMKFEVYPNIGVPLNTKILDRTLALTYKFARKDLMRPGEKIFSITYCVSFALSNSHHSIEFMHNDKINLPELFMDIGKIYIPKKNNIEDLLEKLQLKYIDINLPENKAIKI